MWSAVYTGVRRLPTTRSDICIAGTRYVVHGVNIILRRSTVIYTGTTQVRYIGFVCSRRVDEGGKGWFILAIKMKGANNTYWGGEMRTSYLCDRRSELRLLYFCCRRLGGRVKRRAKIIDGTNEKLPVERKQKQDRVMYTYIQKVYPYIYIYLCI